MQDVLTVDQRTEAPARPRKQSPQEPKTPRETDDFVAPHDSVVPTTQRISPRLIVLLGSVSAFAPLAIDMYLPAFTAIGRDLAASAGSVQLTLSFFLAGLGFGQLICGPVSDRIGRRTPLIVGSFTFALSAVLCTLTPSIELLIASRFLMGLAGAAAIVVSRAVVRDLFNATEAAGVFSMIMLVSGLAPILAPFLGGLLLLVGGWRSIFAVLAVCGAGSGLAVLFDLKEPLEEHRRSRGSIAELPMRYWSILSDGRFLAYALTIGACASLLFAYIAGSPFTFMTIYGVSPEMFPLFFSGNAIGLIGSAQINRFAVRRFGLQGVLRSAVLVNAAASVALLVVASTGLGGFPAFYFGTFVCLASLGYVFPNATAVAMAPFADRAGMASALLGVMQYGLGAFVGAILSLLENGTAVPMAGIMAACGVFGAAVLLLCERGPVEN